MFVLRCTRTHSRHFQARSSLASLARCQGLGVDTIIWLPEGAAHDVDTNGHVDNIACFLRPGVVALLWAEESENEAQHAASAAAFAVLEAARDARGRRLKVVKILAPRPMFRTLEDCDQLVGMKGLECTVDKSAEACDDPAAAQPREVGEILPASYINFYLPNGGTPPQSSTAAHVNICQNDTVDVHFGRHRRHFQLCTVGAIVPQFGDAERDAAALDVLTAEFPDRKVVPVSSREILLGGGNVHCICMQQPASIDLSKADCPSSL
eukprot:SAG31_NODE_6465_length_2007_cov_1.287212_1_plen_266_part_00